MKKICTLLLLLLFLTSLRAQLAIGHWRDHLSFTTVSHIESAPGRLYATGSMGLFFYDIEDFTLNLLTKTTGLSDVGISTFAYDVQTGYLVIAYTNGNLDLYRNDQVYNISDLKRATLDGDKSIFHIRFYNRRAYLACGFGIVVVDLVRHEIENTYYLGEGGTHCAVRDIAFTETQIVAATDSGLLAAPKDDPYLNIVTRWSRDTETLLAGRPVTQLEFDGRTLAAISYLVDPSYKQLYRQQDGNFTLLTEGNIVSLRYANGHWVLLQDDTLKVFNDNFHLTEQRADIGGYNLQATDAVIDADNRLWVAHSWAGLLQMPADRTWAFPLTPNGPASSSVYKLVPNGNSMLLCPGGKTTTFSNAYQPAELCTYNNGKWTTLKDPQGRKDSLRDIVDVAVDPNDTTHLLAACWGYGIADIHDNTLTQVYTDSNSQGALVRYVQGNYNTLLTGAVAFDEEGTAWMTNSLQNTGLVRLQPDGSWKAFNISPMLLSGGQFDRILCDSVNDYLWFYGNKSNRIYVHDGESQQAYINPNYGSKLETQNVNALVQDRSGDIWIGTNKGLKVIYDAYKAFNNGGVGEQSPTTCSNIVISADGIDEYLMAYESITCIAVDGADRKWVGTASGGLYLLSSNGLEELEHFTAANSPLYSDKIICLAILPHSGELFIGTDKGVQSYRTAATYADEIPVMESYAFPNPVRGDYDGPIAIKGLTRDGLVHITDVAGHVVYATQALGGQALWYGRNMDGIRVASGTYYVFAANEKGDYQTVTKILVIR